MAVVSQSTIDERLRAVERVTKLFQLERMTYLGVTVIALAMLLTSAGTLMWSGAATTGDLAMLFGSSGMITYSAGRLLRMWSQALRLISGQDLEQG